MYLDAISSGSIGSLPPVGRALFQVLVTAGLVTVLANVLRAVGFRVALWVPTVAQSSVRRNRRAKAAATELLTGVNCARSVLASHYGDRPPSEDGTDRRAWRRARELQGPADKGVLARWAWFARVEQRTIEMVSRTTVLFGASAVISPRLLFKPLTLLVSAAIVLWRRPPWRLPSMGTIIDSIATAATDARPGRVLPLALLTLGLLLVARPFPIIDRIRARDEAAKDANRLLAELYGQLTQLVYVLHEWREELLVDRHDRVVSYVEEVTQGRRSWGPGGGLVKTRRRASLLRSPRRFPGPEAIGDRLTARIQAIEVVDALIRDKGLVVVARRLTWRVRYPVGELGLLRPLELSADLARAACAPSALYAPDPARILALTAIGAGATSPIPVLDDALLERIESEAFNYARVLDMSIAKVLVCQAQVERVVRHLGGRMVGTWWTRTLSLVQK